MAIELLDVRKQWGRVKAAFSNPRLFQNPPPKPSHPYANGIDPMAAEAQMTASPVKGSVFTGKSFSQRSK